MRPLRGKVAAQMIVYMGLGSKKEVQAGATNLGRDKQPSIPCNKGPDVREAAASPT